MALTVLTIAEDVPAPIMIEAASLRSFGPDEPEEYVARLTEDLAQAMPPVTGLVVYDPIGVASGIRTYLAQEPAALIALATHARSGLDRVRFGATAADIVCTATVPALVIASDS
jgi:nucleotide-binding universal stress UspA family protein